MTRGLAQPQQRLEHVHARLCHALAIDARQERLAVMTAQPVVERALVRVEIAQDRLLGTRRQFGGHLRFRAPQDERTQSAREQVRGVVARQFRRPLEHLRAAEHAGIEELEQAPELAEVILDRRP